MSRSVVFGLQTSAQGSANKFSPLLQVCKCGRRFLVELIVLFEIWVVEHCPTFAASVFSKHRSTLAMGGEQKYKFLLFLGWQ